ncbi:MAG: serine/threonine protein kinase, partial [Muribaculaceae bacterium]|nr:serine/threonine protein kinase [Muribaculaceae bacterium]
MPKGTLLKDSSTIYKVEEVLGAGGYGITYKVTRLSDGKIFALKEFFPNKLCERGENDTMSFLKTNSDVIELGLKVFITEGKRLNRQEVHHPNIVRIEDVFKANDTAYIVMEYIDGDNLRQYIKRNHNQPLTQEQALSVIRPVMQAVALLHNNRLTHLDIKPDNIILSYNRDGSYRPVLIDFGQSKHYDKKGNATSEIRNLGCSEGYSPPEQYLGLTQFTPEADIYAISATLLYLLTGTQPIKSSEISATYISEKLPPEISPEIKNAIIN